MIISFHISTYLRYHLPPFIWMTTVITFPGFVYMWKQSKVSSTAWLRYTCRLWSLGILWDLLSSKVYMFMVHLGCMKHTVASIDNLNSMCVSLISSISICQHTSGSSWIKHQNVSLFVRLQQENVCHYNIGETMRFALQRKMHFFLPMPKCLPAAQKTFAVYLKGGLENPWKRTETREKVSVKLNLT